MPAHIPGTPRLHAEMLQAPDISRGMPKSGKNFLTSDFRPLSPAQMARYQGEARPCPRLRGSFRAKTVSSGILLTSFAYFLSSLQDASVEWLVVALPAWLSYYTAARDLGLAELTALHERIQVQMTISSGFFLICSAGMIIIARERLDGRLGGGV